jgi:hypothetical protein
MVERRHLSVHDTVGVWPIEQLTLNRATAPILSS